MTLRQLVRILEDIAMTQPNVRTACEGNIYDLMNGNPSVTYDAFVITQTRHYETETYDQYGLTLFYVSRLEDDLENNRLQAQSIGKEVLGNVIRTFCEEYDTDFPRVEYVPFTQKFSDLTAGVYCNLTMEIPIDYICAEYFDD